VQDAHTTRGTDGGCGHTRDHRGRDGARVGRARVLVDGHLVTTIDTASATRTDRMLGFQWQFATRGLHTIEVVAVSAAPVTVDAAVSN
jgi:hypothetical protein